MLQQDIGVGLGGWDSVDTIDLNLDKIKNSLIHLAIYEISHL